MQHHQHGQPEPPVQVAHQLDDLELAADVEKSGRLVEQQQLRLLREGHRDPRPLPLAAGEGCDAAVPQFGQPGHPEHLGDYLAVVRIHHAKPGAVREAPETDQFIDCDFTGGVVQLRQDRHPARQRGGVAGVDRLAVEQHIAGFRLQQPPDHLEQGGFAAAVGTEQRDDAPFGDGKPDAVEHQLGAVPGAELLYFKLHSCASSAATGRKAAPAAT